MIKVSDRVYAETKYEGANTTCIVTERGLVLVESPMLPEDARDWLAQIRSVSDKEVAYLISTDHHFDHVFTNSFFTRRTIGHRNTYRGIAVTKETLQIGFDTFFPGMWEKRKDELSQIEVLLPQITFDTKMSLNMGDCTLELTHMGGHCFATIMIYIPEEKVLCSGDNVEQGQHSYPGYGRYRRWIELLGEMEQMDVKAIVPGHGDICGLDQARLMRVYYEALRDQIKQVRDAGGSKEEALKKVDLVSLSPANTGQTSKKDISEQIATDVTCMYEQLEKGLI